jgi:hypothetical protein
MEMINGYVCKSCCDVEYAKKHIDPAHPKDGPYREKRVDQASTQPPSDSFGPAVKIGDQTIDPVKPDAPVEASRATGKIVDLTA